MCKEEKRKERKHALEEECEREREGEIEEVNFLYTISDKRLLTHEMVELRVVMNHYVDYCHWVINIPWKKPLANHRG